ncbi:MAG: exodeoxyribonuclease VII large subunit [Clostridia bacterium]|nr:exodeoxyribonuclease VII large subunit [Clostridia bacterium]
MPVRDSAGWILSVTELNRYISGLVRDDALLKGIRLRGQVSGIHFSAAGHWYFDLKEDSHTIPVVVFRQSAQRQSFRPRNGDQLIVHGDVSVYENECRVQLVADSLRPEGVGLLWQRFEALKQQLTQEGLFDRSRKRPLPARPRRIAIVTSETGAVLHDICTVAARRDPGIPLALVPAPVQGEGAAEGLVTALRKAAALPGVDVVIIGRGGGSMEDLWCFNEEILARAIAACPVPVISAVGHETDFTIADFAADLRAATPSNAAELAVPDRSETLAAFELMRHRLDSAARDALRQRRQALLEAAQGLERVSPERRLRELSAQTAQTRLRLEGIGPRLLPALEQRLAMSALRLDTAADKAIESARQRLSQRRNRLEALNPQRVLERGYALVTSGDRVVTSAQDAPARMRLRFRDGAVDVRRDDSTDSSSSTD